MEYTAESFTIAYLLVGTNHLNTKEIISRNGPFSLFVLPRRFLSYVCLVICESENRMHVDNAMSHEAGQSVL